MRIAIVCAACLGILGLGSGMAAADQNVAFALKGGVNWASISVEPEVSELDSWMRPGGGICLSFPLNPKVWLDIDALYLPKGALQPTGIPETVDTEWRFNYAVVSPMFRFAPGGPASGPYLLGGFEVGYLIDWEIIYDDGFGGTESYSEDGVIEDLDYGVTVGGGLQMTGSGGVAFFIEGRYTLGLQDITQPPKDGEGSQSGDDNEIETRGIYAFAGLRF